MHFTLWFTKVVLALNFLFLMHAFVPFWYLSLLWRNQDATNTKWKQSHLSVLFLKYEGCNKIDERNPGKNKKNNAKILNLFSKRRTDSCALACCFRFFEQNLKHCLKIRLNSWVTCIKYNIFKFLRYFQNVSSRVLTGFCSIQLRGITAGCTRIATSKFKICCKLRTFVNFWERKSNL